MNHGAKDIRDEKGVLGQICIRRSSFENWLSFTVDPFSFSAAVHQSS